MSRSSRSISTGPESISSTPTPTLSPSSTSRSRARAYVVRARSADPAMASSCARAPWTTASVRRSPSTAAISSCNARSLGRRGGSLHRADRVRHGPAPLLADVACELSVANDLLGRLEARVELERQDIGIQRTRQSVASPPVVLRPPRRSAESAPPRRACGRTSPPRGPRRGRRAAAPAVRARPPARTRVVACSIDAAQHLVRAVEVPELHERLSEIGRQRQSRGVGVVEGGHRPAEEVGGRWRSPRTNARRPAVVSFSRRARRGSGRARRLARAVR